MTVTAASPRELLLALNAAPHLSRPAVYRLASELERWQGSSEPPEALAAAMGVPRKQVEKILAVAREAPRIADRELAEAERLQAQVVSLDEPGYPAALRQLPMPPPILYIKGQIPEGPAIAMVGSRQADSYGSEVAELFARSLAAAGVTVVSGFARGIDAAAHRGALAAEGGRTVAVLGCGLGVDYPRGHAKLGQEIAGRGALVTEFPCGLAPRSWHFPVRNRAIAALGIGTLVVQAAPRSGSLVTARHAVDLGRDVWAIPGRIFDERSLGPNALIQDGATLVQHPKDILDALLPAGAPRIPLFTPEPEPRPAEPEPPPGLAGQILAILPPGAIRLPEEIAAGLDESVDQVLGALLDLELEGWIKRLPGGAYSR